MPQRDSLPDAELELPRLRGNIEVDEASKRLATRFDLARQVIRARAILGWTQADLAKAANTKQSRVSEIESAKGNPTLETIERILNALNLRVSFGPAGSRMFFASVSYRPTATEYVLAPRKHLKAGGRRTGRLVQPSKAVAFEAAGESTHTETGSLASASRFRTA
jgi:transcriptional regulator with XRE-family HTH domain